MSDDPVRLRDDPRLSNALRRDLVRASHQGVAAPGFDASAALASFEAARARGGSGAGSASASHTMRSARWWGIGAVGVATLIAAVMLARRPWQSTSGTHSISAPSIPTAPGVESAPVERPMSPAVGAPSVIPPAATVQPPAEIRPTRSGSAGRTASNGPLGARDSAEPALRGTSSAAPPSARATADQGAGEHRDSSGAHAISSGATDDLGRDERMLTNTYALLDVDPANALASANAGIREFPASRHLEDREAIAVRALAALHRSAEARARGERFLGRWPSSPQALMVRQAMMR